MPAIFYLLYKVIITKSTKKVNSLHGRALDKFTPKRKRRIMPRCANG